MEAADILLSRASVHKVAGEATAKEAKEEMTALMATTFVKEAKDETAANVASVTTLTYGLV